MSCEIVRMIICLVLRSLTGLDRPAAKAAFSQITGSSLTASQMEFIDLIIDHLCESGTIDPARFYESPFTDLDARGIKGVFDPPQIRSVVEVVQFIHDTAAA